MNKAQALLDKAQKYNNTNDMLYDLIKISSNEKFDAIIIAPSWLPEKILVNYDAEIICMTKHTYISSYIVKFDGLNLVWVQCASGASNLMDHSLLFSNSVTEKIIFLGAVGGLVDSVGLGDIVTPSEALAYTGANLYLTDTLDSKMYGSAVKPHNQSFINKVIEKAHNQGINISKRKTFCTDSVVCEYTFLDEIKDTGAEVIEMETAAFYQCIELMNKDGIALLCVSDNSALGVSLTSRTEEELAFYHNSRIKSIPEIIKIVCQTETN